MSGHQGFILANAFDVTGERLFSCSIEGDVCVWDVQRRVLLESWRCHRGPILDLKLRNDELVSAGLDGTVGLWRASDGGLIRRLEKGHAGGVHGVAVADAWIAAGSSDRRISLWDRRTDALTRMLEGHEETVTSLAFLDAQTLVSGSRDRTVRLWNLADGTERAVLRGHDWWVTKVGVASNERLLSCSEDGTLRVWDPDSAEALWAIDDAPGPIWGLAISNQGNQAVVGYGGEVLLLDLDSRSAERLPSGLAGSPRAMSFSPDDALLAIGKDHGDIELIDLQAGNLIGRLRGVGRRIISGVVKPDLASTGQFGGEVESLSANGELTRHQGHDAFVYSSRYLAGDRFATGSFDRKVRIWALGQEAPLAEFDHGGLIFSLCVNRDGTQLLAAGWDRITLLELISYQVVWQLAAADVGGHLVAAFGADGRTVAGVGEMPILKVWHPTIGKSEEEESESWPLPDAHNCVIESVPAENRMLVGSAYGRVSLVDLDEQTSQPLHGEHEDWIRIARVSPDGQRLLTISQNGSARIYDRSQGRVVERFARRPVAIGDFDSTGVLHWLDCLGNSYSE